MKKRFCRVMAAFFISLAMLSSVCIFPVHAQTSSSSLNYPKDGEITYATYNSSFLPWTNKEDIIPLWIDFANKTGGTYESIGKSSAPQQWDIIAFKFGNPNKPSIMINSYLHGNEQYGYEVLYALANWLVSNDTTAKSILANNYVIFIPVVDYRWARTNFNYQNVADPILDVDDNQVSGVDLNRNFAPSWSDTLTGQEYSGVQPDSEPESQALINAWTKYQPRFYWTLHHGSTRIYTEAIATTNQQQNDLNNLKDLLPEIAEEVGVSSSMFKIYVQTAFGSCYGGSGKGFAIDGASSHGAVGIITELKTSWRSTDDIQGDLNSGSTFKQAKAFFIAMAETIQSESSGGTSGQSSSSSSSSSSTGNQNSGSKTQTPAASDTTELPSDSSNPATPETSTEASPLVPANIAVIIIVIIVAVVSIGIVLNVKKRKK
ncbi:MAG: M14 family zinc carboxypeptidase [Candidatus Bathyarchaeia archaeon]